MTSPQVIFALQDLDPALEQFQSFSREMYQRVVLDDYKWQVIGYGGLSKDDADVFRETSSAGITILAGDDSELLWAWANATSWSDAHAGSMWEPTRGEDDDGLVEGDVSSGEDQASTNMTQGVPHASFASRAFTTGLLDSGYTTVVGIMVLLLMYC
jgi:hypothetical protein